LETQYNQNFTHESEIIKKDPILLPLTHTEILDRIVSALELEELKAPSFTADNYANTFNEVGNINYCPEVIKFTPFLKKNLNKINKDTKSDRFKEKKFLKEILL
jgi:hypothetical protein